MRELTLVVNCTLQLESLSLTFSLLSIRYLNSNSLHYYCELSAVCQLNMHTFLYCLYCVWDLFYFQHIHSLFWETEKTIDSLCLNADFFFVCLDTSGFSGWSGSGGGGSSRGENITCTCIVIDWAPLMASSHMMYICLSFTVKWIVHPKMQNTKEGIWKNVSNRTNLVPHLLPW